VLVTASAATKEREESRSEAWAPFERAVDAVVKSGSKQKVTPQWNVPKAARFKRL
jgi:hypothetical protein